MARGWRMNASVPNKVLRRGETVRLQITGFTHDGRGVAAFEGKKGFVHGALPGETVSVRIDANRSQYFEATTVSIVKASPHRVDPPCPHFGVCGGCSLQHLTPADQITMKQDTLAEHLRRIGGVVPEQWAEPLVDRDRGYRRKARLGVRYVAKKKRVLVGFRERKGHFLADMDRCEILVESVGQRLGELARLIEALTVREHIAQIEVLSADNATVLVFRHLAPLPPEDRQRLRDYAERTGLAMALQSGGPDSIEPLYPAEQDLWYALPEHDVRLAIRPGDFLQVHAGINQQMINVAMEWLAIEAGDRVLEWFSGLGNFSLPMLRLGAHVTAIEGESTMTRRASENARQAGLDVHHQALTTNLFEPDPEAIWMREHYDKLLLDPPRSGAQAALRLVDRIRPKSILYCSCDPATLARDAGDLVKERGYRLARVRVMDMFPHTAHVESMALFVRQD